MTEKGYMAYIRTQPCAITGYVGEEVDASHLEGKSWLTGKSAGSKGHFLSCIPLRHDKHAELHRIGWKSFEAKYNTCQMELALKTIFQAERDGIFKT